MSTRSTPAWHTTIDRRQAGERSDVEVEVRTSTRRRKYSTAFWQGDRIVVVLPGRLPAKHHDEIVDDLVSRVLTHRPHVSTSDDQLLARAAELADRYVDGVRPTSIRWVTNQNSRWGSCSLASRQIRISHRLRAAPTWVLDAVVVHELVHLVEQSHGPRFRAIAARYPRMDEADIYLAGYSLGLGQAGPGGLDADDRPTEAGDGPDTRTDHVTGAGRDDTGGADGHRRGGTVEAADDGTPTDDRDGLDRHDRHDSHDRHDNLDGHDRLEELDRHDNLDRLDRLDRHNGDDGHDRLGLFPAEGGHVPADDGHVPIDGQYPIGGQYPTDGEHDSLSAQGAADEVAASGQRRRGPRRSAPQGRLF